MNKINYQRIIAITVLVLSAGVILGPNLFSSGLDSNTSVWNTSTLWDAGTTIGTGIDSASRSCLAKGNGIQLNATGTSTADLYGASSLCPSGSPMVSTVNLTHSWDMKTMVTSPYIIALKDFASGIFLKPFKTLNVTGEFGASTWIPRTGYLQTTSVGTDGLPWGKNKLYPQVTFVMRFRQNLSSPGIGNIYQLVYDGAQGTAAEYFDFYLVDSVAGFWRLFWQYATGSAAISVAIANFTANDSLWHTLAIRVNYTNRQVQSIYDGTPQKSVTMSSAITSGITGFRELTILGYAGVYGLSMPVDLFQIYDTWLSNGYIKALSGIGKYELSGTWFSPVISTTNEYPYAITLSIRNNSVCIGCPFVALLEIDNSNGTLWTDTEIQFASGTYNITYILLPAGRNWPMGSQSYGFDIGLGGYGNSTVSIDYAALVFAPFAANPPTLDANAILLILLLFVLTILFIAGFIERFAMVGAAIDSFIIAILAFTWTKTEWASALFVILGAVCIGFAITKKVSKGEGIQ